MDIAVLGYGTVGKSVCRIAAERLPALHIKYVLEKRGFADGFPVTDDIGRILGDESISLVVDALPGIHPSFEYIQKALCSRKHVVTSNKAALAHDYALLMKLATEHGVSLFYEAACGGGIPIIEETKRAAALNEITAFSGILNGTSNYILDRMAKTGADFGEVLKEAQALGYAEADPTADIGGFDVQNKTVILANTAWHTSVPADFPVIGIKAVSRARIGRYSAAGKAIKLMALGRREKDRYALAVVPVVLPETELFAHVPDNFNLVSITGDRVGRLQFYGQGAGGDPTADAVLRDVLAIGRGETAGMRGAAETEPAALRYDPSLLCGTVCLGDEVIPHAVLADYAGKAAESDVFFAFEPEDLF